MSFSLYSEKHIIMKSRVHYKIGESMKKLSFTNSSNVEINVYADKSASILEWLLVKGIGRKSFSLSEVMRDIGVSIGLIQKVFNQLVFNGFLTTEGFGTSKKFMLSKPKSLMTSWTQSYDLTKKCRIWNYSSAYRGRKELFDVLKNSGLKDQVVVALHSSSDLYKCSTSNLETLELYIPEIKMKSQIEKALCLEPLNRGYEVLLIEPYYKHMVRSCLESDQKLHQTRPILTYLDLFHFPLRGIEQAEYMAENMPEIKRIFSKGNL